MSNWMKELQRKNGCVECFCADAWALKRGKPCCTKISLSFSHNPDTGFCLERKIRNGDKEIGR